MLSREENELVTRVGQGTPMGDTLRRYWIPALLSREIAEPDGPPARVRLLGEDLVAFRDSEGRIGLLDELCPHRRASLFFGRNEECGLRCVYHGWKFDVAGACTDMMNEPEENDFKHKVRLTAYPTCRTGRHHLGLSRPGRTHAAAAEIRLDAGAGIASPRHQGDPGVQLAPGPGRRHRHLARADHASAADAKPPPAAASSRPARSSRGKAPKLVVDITDYGYQYAGIRPLGDSEMHIRTYQFIMPFHQIRPSKSETGLPLDAGHIWVPIDDENHRGLQLGLLPGWAAGRGRPAGTRPRQRTAACRSGDVPFEGQPFEQLHAGPAGAEDRKLHRHRRHQRAGPRHPGEHGAASSIARRSILARPTRRSSRRASCCARR